MKSKNKPNTNTRNNLNMELKEPSMIWDVVLHNDDITPLNIVTKVLCEVFAYDESDANDFALLVHNKGRAVIGSYLVSIAELKKETSILFAKEYGYNLEITIEENKVKG